MKPPCQQCGAARRSAASHETTDDRELHIFHLVRHALKLGVSELQVERERERGREREREREREKSNHRIRKEVRRKR